MRKYLTYANVMATLAVVLVVAGGTAYAANTVLSTDIVNGEVKSVDIGTGQVHSVDVKNEGLTGADIADNSGVDTCPGPIPRFDELCAGNDGVIRTWLAASDQCALYGLRLPTVGEARMLAVNFAVPGVDPSGAFWADVPPSGGFAHAVTEAGALATSNAGDSLDTVCVTIPTN
jgi:hypothetical protein